MAEWEGKSKGTPLGYQFFIFLIKNVGLSAAYTLLYPVAAYYYLFSRKTNLALREYLQILKRYHPAVSRTSVYQIYYNLGQVLIDKTAVLSGANTNFEVFRDGVHHLVEMDRKGTGGFLIGAHVGNWEIATHLMQHLSLPVNIVLLDQEHEAIKQVMEKAIGKRSVNIIPLKEDMSHIFKIHRAAQNKELICMHGDRFLPGSKTIGADFMGEKALFPEGPFILAHKLNLPVSFVYGMKEGSNNYHLYCTRPLQNPAGPKVIFKAYLHLLEKMVVKYPNQWYNFHSFWSGSNPKNAKQ